MTPDWSAAPKAVPYADLGNPQSLNLYSYVLNNPVTSVDGDGHCCDLLEMAVTLQIAHAVANSPGPAPALSLAQGTPIPTPNWQYSESSGAMTLQVGPRTILSAGTGYSGHGVGLNNPADELTKNEGPIPTGEYSIGPMADHKTQQNKKLPKSMILTPVPGPKAKGRDGFLIHGDNAKGNNSASDGCIVLCKQARGAVSSSGVTKLKVVHK